jgi:hypothetical protein
MFMSDHYKENLTDGWIGVDFDGTLVYYDEWVGPEHIGAPIYLMINRVKNWLAEGKKVRIFTARVYSSNDNAAHQRDAALSLLAIQRWSDIFLGEVLPVTFTKDHNLLEFWDDRAVQVKINTGERVDKL